MSVSESLDWRRCPLARLSGHRFIGRTAGGQVVDGWLVADGTGVSCTDRDGLTTVLIGGHVMNRLHAPYTSVNVLSDTFQGGRLLGGHDDKE